MAALGERSVLIDCDVLQADGGTRTRVDHRRLRRAGARARAAAQRRRCSTRCRSPDSVAAVSVGHRRRPRCCSTSRYAEDQRAEVDLNVVMTGAGRFVEVQGTAEGKPFTPSAARAHCSRSAGRASRELTAAAARDARGRRRACCAARDDPAALVLATAQPGQGRASCARWSREWGRRRGAVARRLPGRRAARGDRRDVRRRTPR